MSDANDNSKYDVITESEPRVSSRVVTVNLAPRSTLGRILASIVGLLIIGVIFISGMLFLAALLAVGALWWMITWFRVRRRLSATRQRNEHVKSPPFE